jgi:hypothetical protein
MFLELFKKIIRPFFFDGSFDDLSLSIAGSQEEQEKEDREWKMEDGGWKMEDGGLRMENGMFDSAHFVSDRCSILL